MSQTSKILNHLLQGYSITPIEALRRFDCFRLAARIKDIRNEGYDIITVIVDNDKGRKHFAKYFMKKVDK